MTDIRYDYAQCAKCGREWKWIDFGCALHIFTCDDPAPTQEAIDQLHAKGAWLLGEKRQ